LGHKCNLKYNFFLLKFIQEDEVDDQELFFISEGEIEIFIQNKTGFKEDTILKILEAGFLFLINFVN